MKKSTQAAVEARLMLEACVSKEEIEVAASEAARLVMSAGAEPTIIDAWVRAAYLRIGAKISNSEAFKLPTPPIGDIVIWYEHGIASEGKCFPAIVYAQLEPGVLTLIPIKPSGIFGTARATTVFWEKHHAIRSPSSEKRRTCGSWDYPKGRKIPKDDYAFQQELEQRDLAISKRDEDRAAMRKLIQQQAEEERAKAAS